MTETAPCDHVQAVGSLEEELRGIEAAWINAEFEALIAENWNSEPPRPPEPPVCLPARWPNEEHAAPSRITSTAEAPTSGLEKPGPTTIPAQVQIVCRMVALLSTGPRRTWARLLLTRVPARRSSADSLGFARRGDL